MTIKQAKTELAALGITLKKTAYGEFQVAPKGNGSIGVSRPAYYTNDLADAIATGKLMARKAS